MMLSASSWYVYNVADLPYSHMNPAFYLDTWSNLNLVSLGETKSSKILIMQRDSVHEMQQQVDKDWSESLPGSRLLCFEIH